MSNRYLTGGDGRAGIDAALVHRLVAEQFPQWADQAVVPVEVDGWDNRTYRLGNDLSVRLPTHARYLAGIEQEDRWLPVLAPHLPLPIPEPVATGRPGAGYPFTWSVRRWLVGQPARPNRIADLGAFALELAGFLRTLRAVDATGGPAAGEHSFYRGASLRHYDDETRRAIETLAPEIDSAAATTVWDTALLSEWSDPPVWFHGDVAAGNLLIRDGRLAAVIDFGTCGVGDPACDLAVAWTLLTGPSRAAFRDHIGLDGATWDRGRGWALWKALSDLVHNSIPANRTAHRRILTELGV